MKKVFGTALFADLILSTRNSLKLSFSEIENVPRNLEEHINSNIKLQLINDGAKDSYVIFRSKGEIGAELDVQDNIVNIIFKEINPQEEAVKQNVYYLTTDSKHDKINVLVNSKKVPFDEVTGL